MRKGVLTKTSIKVLLSLLLLIGSFEPVVSASYGGSKPADVTFESYFPLREVRLLDSPFLDLQRKGKEYLLWLNPDSLLHFYRIEAGLPSKAAPYAGWESQDVWGAGPLRGGFLGFYLSSVSMMYQSTDDKRLLKRLKYVLKELELCQKAGKTDSGLPGKQSHPCHSTFPIKQKRSRKILLLFYRLNFTPRGR